MQFWLCFIDIHFFLFDSSSWYIKATYLLRFCGDHVRLFFFCANYTFCTLAQSSGSVLKIPKMKETGWYWKLFLLGTSLLVDASSPRTVSIDKKKISSGTHRERKRDGEKQFWRLLDLPFDSEDKGSTCTSRCGSSSFNSHHFARDSWTSRSWEWTRPGASNPLDQTKVVKCVVSRIMNNCANIKEKILKIIIIILIIMIIVVIIRTVIMILTMKRT